MGEVVQIFQPCSSARRPSTHDAAIHGEFYRVFALYLRRRVPGFVHEMEDSVIVKALRMTGPPKGSVNEYIAAMIDAGWSGFTDDVQVVLTDAFTIFEQVYTEAIENWVKLNNIKAPINNGDAIKYGSECGHGFLTETLSKSGQLLFRDKNWIALNGNRGGVLVNWEDVMLSI